MDLKGKKYLIGIDRVVDGSVNQLTCVINRLSDRLIVGAHSLASSEHSFEELISMVSSMYEDSVVCEENTPVVVLKRRKK